jgi:hypothetical protein
MPYYSAMAVATDSIAPLLDSEREACYENQSARRRISTRVGDPVSWTASFAAVGALARMRSTCFPSRQVICPTKAMALTAKCRARSWSGELHRAMLDCCGARRRSGPSPLHSPRMHGNLPILGIAQ